MRWLYLWAASILVLIGLLISTAIDPGLDISNPALLAFWPWLEIAALAVGVVTLFASYKLFHHRGAIAKAPLIATVVLALAAIGATPLFRERLTSYYGQRADVVFQTAKSNPSIRQFGKAASASQAELSAALASDKTPVRRTRTLPRYSAYHYELTPPGSGTPILVEMTIERGQPALVVSLPSDLRPNFEGR